MNAAAGRPKAGAATAEVVLPRDDAGLVARLGTDQDPLSDDALTGRFRVLQRVNGHRYSLDDVLTADLAVRALPAAQSHADIGCGLGSVLLMVADRLAPRRQLGVEAQAVSFELATRNVARNGLGDVVELRHADLRALASDAALARRFDLVTGTPPYVGPGRSTPAPDPQKAYARVEYRGGIEDYLLAAAHLLAERGRAVVCCDARASSRAERGAADAGLVITDRLDAIPRAGTAPLFSVFCFARVGDAEPNGNVRTFVARDEDGRRSRDYLDLRAAFGLPPAYDPHDRTHA